MSCPCPKDPGDYRPSGEYEPCGAPDLETGPPRLLGGTGVVSLMRRECVHGHKYDEEKVIVDG